MSWMKQQVSKRRREQLEGYSRIATTTATYGLWLSAIAYLLLLTLREEKSAAFLTQRPYKTALPDFPLVKKVFAPDERFLQWNSREGDAFWEAITGPNNTRRFGMVTLDKSSENYDYLQPSPFKNAKGQEIYGISMLHQLHCLNAIRTHFWAFATGEQNPHFFMSKSGDESKTKGPLHIAHCFDYIRQGLQCAGDVSLEWPTDKMGDRDIINGMGIPHQCKNWGTIWDYLERHTDRE